MVWVVSRFRLKAPPGISSSCISPLSSSGQRSRASRASQPQKSATLSPQPGGKPQKFIRTCGGTGGNIERYKEYAMFSYCLEEDTNLVENKYVMPNFRLPPQCKWDLCSSGMLWNIDSVLCNTPEAWRRHILYARHKVSNGNWQTSTCDLLSIYSNMHNIIVSIKGDVWLTSQCRKWKLFVWNMVQLLSIMPRFH
jgi:hypothetical protein